MPEEFPVILGFDMETDVGSWTPYFEGLINGTPLLLDLLRQEGAAGTFFFVGDVAKKHPAVVRRVLEGGHEVGCHSLYHETVGESLFPIPGMVPLLQHEVRPRLELAHRWVKEASGGVEPVSFRAPRLFGSTDVVRALEGMGYIADASLPMYYYTERLAPYHPDPSDWTAPGEMRIWEFPNFADLTIDSRDEYGRDRDQWPLFRTHSAAHLMKHVDSFIRHVRERGVEPVLTFYFHPWEFWAMPQGPIHYGEGAVVPDPFLVKNCGEYALEQLALLLGELKSRGATFTTCAAYAGGAAA